jgi:hypothetical protein
VLIDLIDWYSSCTTVCSARLLTGASLGASRRLARDPQFHIVERFLWKRGVSVLDSWSFVVPLEMLHDTGLVL